MEGFKYIKNISTDGEGTILIYKQIGNSVDSTGRVIYGVNGADFAAEMEYLKRVCSKITVRINSVGGSVLEGYSIASAIFNASNSGTPVETVNDGLAASTALWCLAAGTPGMRKSKDYGSGMTHNSSGAKDKTVSNIVDESINTILSNRSKKTPEEIKSMMDKETWMNAKQMLDFGFVDSIESTGNKIKFAKNESLENMALIYNKYTTPNMDKVNNILGLRNDASEDSAVEAINTLKSNNQSLEAKNKELSEELEALKAEKAENEKKAAEALKNKATEAANNLKKEGKLKDSEVANFITNASKSQADFDFLTGLVSGQPSNKEAKKVFDAKNQGAKPGGEDRATWTYRDWESKDLKGLQNMYVNDPDQYEALLKTI